MSLDWDKREVQAVRHHSAPSEGCAEPSSSDPAPYHQRQRGYVGWQCNVLSKWHPWEKSNCSSTFLDSNMKDWSFEIQIIAFFSIKVNICLWHSEKTEWIKYYCIGKPQTWTTAPAVLFSLFRQHRCTLQKASQMFPLFGAIKSRFTDLNYIHCSSFFFFSQMMMALKPLIMKKTYFYVGFLVLLALNTQLNICLKQSIWKSEKSKSKSRHKYFFIVISNQAGYWDSELTKIQSLCHNYTNFLNLKCPQL